MRELYDRLLEEGEDGIDRLIAEGMQESLQLDFKRKEVDRNGEFSTNDRRMLAEALSGFANSAGGLLVVGMDARKGADGIDCAQEARPIADIRRFLADANTEVGRLVQPRLDGVSVAAIASHRIPGAGYLAVYVERSERRPHRSEAKGQKGYFRRIGDSFFEMEHYDIEDAFSRTASPKIEIIFVEAEITHDLAGYQFRFDVLLQNSSEHIAKHPFVSFKNFYGAGLLQRHYTPPFKLFSDGRIGSLSGGVDDVIHPGTHVLAGKIAVIFDRDERTHGPWQMMGERSATDGPSFDYLFGCEGMRGEIQSWSKPRSSFRLPR